MPTIKTAGFTLATIEAGSVASSQLALVLPGRLETKDYAHIVGHITHLATLGYHAVAFDPPGSWESGSDLEDYTVTNYLKAVNELIEYYDNKPTLLIGHSLGGSVAMLAAAQNPAVKGFISLMTAVGKGVADEEWRVEGKVTFFRDLPPGDKPTPKSEQRQFNLPYSYFEDSQQYSTAEAVRSCTKPKQFIAGIYDTQTPLEDVKQTFDMAARPKQFIKVPSYHGYRYSKVGIAEIDKIISRFVSEQF